MLRTVLAAAVGGVVAGAIALVSSAQGRSDPAPMWERSGQPAAYASNGFDKERPAHAVAVTDARALDSDPIVECRIGERAAIGRRVVAGREVASLVCVETEAPAAVARPVSQPDIVERPAVVRTVAARQAPAARRAPEARTWKKTALVIGGSAGAGAGVGALAGGKKGALIGAAVGGGAATIYEVAKRR